MNDFLTDVFTELDATSSVKLAQISSVFTSVFFSKRFWQLRAREHHLPTDEYTIHEIINEIRRIRNREHLPQYLICSHIRLPDSSFRIVDFYIKNSTIVLLCKNENDTWVEAIYQSSPDATRSLYKGIIWRNGIVDKDKQEFLKHYSTNRDFILSEYREWKGRFVRYHEYLFETTWPFKVYNWRTKSYVYELQTMIQSLGDHCHLVHVQLGHSLYIITRTDIFTVHVFRGSDHLTIPCDYSIPLCTEIFFSDEFWCFRDQNKLTVCSLQVAIFEFFFPPLLTRKYQDRRNPGHTTHSVL
jgi:hypothetical protein